MVNFVKTIELFKNSIKTENIDVEPIPVVTSNSNDNNSAEHNEKANKSVEPVDDTVKSEQIIATDPSEEKNTVLSKEKRKITIDDLVKCPYEDHTYAISAMSLGLFTDDDATTSCHEDYMDSDMKSLDSPAFFKGNDKKKDFWSAKIFFFYLREVL